LRSLIVDSLLIVDLCFTDSPMINDSTIKDPRPSIEGLGPLRPRD
jgi:hypothetical protein